MGKTSAEKGTMEKASWSNVGANWQNSKDQRLEVGRLVADEIRLGVHSRSDREDRWDQLETLYFDRAPSRPYEPYKGAADSHLPIVQPKVDALGSLVVGTIMSGDVPCRAVPYVEIENEQTIVSRKEALVWSVLKSAKFREAIDAVSPIAGYTNCGHVFSYWDKYKGKLCLEVARPKEVVVFPAANIEKPSEAKSLFRQRWVRRSQLDAMRGQEGWLKDKDPSTGGDPNSDTNPYGKFRIADTDGKMVTLNQDWELAGTMKPDHSATRSEDMLVELYEGVFSAPGADGKEAKFWGIIDFKAECFQYIEPLEGETHGCFKFGYKPETGFGYWDRSSVADNLQEIQLYANELLSLSIDGCRFSTFGSVFGSSYTGTSGDLRTEPGQIVLGLVLEPQGMMIPRPDLTWVLPTLQYLVSYADIVARVSAETTGGQPKKNTTATEIQARIAGQGAGVEAYIRTFGKGIRDMFAYVEKLLIENFESFAASDVGISLAVSQEDLNVLMLPCDWELVAESPEATPMAHLNYLQTAVMPLAGNPMSGIDPYNLTARVLDYGERLGGFDKSGIQSPRDPMAATLQLAQVLGIDPNILAGHVQEAVNEQAGQTAPMGEGMAGGPPGVGGEPQQPSGEIGPDGLPAGLGIPGPEGDGLLNDPTLFAG